MNLSLLVIVPFFASLAVLAGKGLKQIRLIALFGSVLQLGISIWLLAAFWQARSAGDTSVWMFEHQHLWYPSWNIGFHIGVDGISVAMILLTALVVVSGVLVSWWQETQSKEFFFLLMLLSMGAYGFFISLDLFTLFFFLEVAVIPKFLLIGIWGSGKKEYSAMKLALMLMGGSALILIGLLLTYFNSNDGNREHTFDILKLAAHPVSGDKQFYIFPLLFAGFGVFTAMFPFHTWAPDGHSSAPTAASMFLAGISMKLGGYGCLRVATYLMPEGAQQYSWLVILLASIAIVYGAFATLMQTDLK